MKQLKLVVMAMLVAMLYGCTQDSIDPVAPAQEISEPLPASEVDAIVLNTLEQNDGFDWKMVSDEVVWSVLNNFDGIISVGYQPSGEGDISKRMHEINITEAAWVEAKDRIINDVINTVNGNTDSNITREELVVKERTKQD